MFQNGAVAGATDSFSQRCANGAGGERSQTTVLIVVRAVGAGGQPVLAVGRAGQMHPVARKSTGRRRHLFYCVLLSRTVSRTVISYTSTRFHQVRHFFALHCIAPLFYRM